MKNTQLLEKIVQLVVEERRIGIEILELLREIERRKLYSDLGYDGLFSFCVKELKYSEAQAYRRIQAMRAIREMPELKEKIETGALTVTTVSQVQTHLSQQKRQGVVIEKAEKIKIFESIQNESAKEVELRLQKMANREITQKLVLNLDPEMESAWQSIKNLSAHSTHGQPEEILKMLMREWLRKNDPQASDRKLNGHQLNGTDKKSHLKKELVRKDVGSKELAGHASVGGAFVKEEKTETHLAHRAAVPIATRRFVWKRDQGKCTHCGSTYALQLDHIVPVAKGGKHHFENLRLLCRSCNLRSGIRHFGLAQMKRSA